MKLKILLMHDPVTIDDKHVLEFVADRVVDHVELVNGWYTVTSEAEAMRLVVDADAFDAAHPGFDLMNKAVCNVIVNGRVIAAPRPADVFESAHGDKRVYMAMED